MDNNAKCGTQLHATEWAQELMDQSGQLEPAPYPSKVAAILEEARLKIAEAAGVSPDSISLMLQIQLPPELSSG